MTPQWYQMWTRDPATPDGYPYNQWLWVGWYYGTFYDLPFLKHWLSCQSKRKGETFVILNRDGSPSFEKRC